jgi:hypothetical protein
MVREKGPPLYTYVCPRCNARQRALAGSTVQHRCPVFKAGQDKFTTFRRID